MSLQPKQMADLRALIREIVGNWRKLDYLLANENFFDFWNSLPEEQQSLFNEAVARQLPAQAKGILLQNQSKYVGVHVTELRSIARRRGMKYYSMRTKAEIIDYLKGLDDDEKATSQKVSGDNPDDHSGSVEAVRGCGSGVPHQPDGRATDDAQGSEPEKTLEQGQAT